MNQRELVDNISFNVKSGTIFLTSYECDTDYKMALCQKHDAFPSMIHYLTMD